MPQHPVRRQADLAVVIEANQGARGIDAQADHQHDPAQHQVGCLVASLGEMRHDAVQEWHSMLAVPGNEWQAVEPDFDPCRQRRLHVTKDAFDPEHH